MSAASRLALSPSAFLDWEAAQDERHEYHRGDVFAMAGGTEPHARIITNCVLALSAALKGRGCTVYTDALRVRVEAEDLFTYPDLSVVCGPGQFYDLKRTTLLDPMLLVEVLSPSTETYDRTTKLRFYRQIPGLATVLLVAQDAPAVDVVARDGDGWRITTESGGEVTVEALGIRLALADLYDGVEFSGETDRPSVRA